MPSVHSVDAHALARRRGAWRRVVATDALARLADVAQVAEVDVNLRFELDERGRPHVNGRCRLNATVCCCRCLREESVAVESGIDLRVVASEAEAAALMPECDAVVGNGPMQIAELIEDDLLMSLPEIACMDRDTCPHAPVADAAANANRMERRRPFAELAALRGKLRR